jgi:hypothetical protein
MPDSGVDAGVPDSGVDAGSMYGVQSCSSLVNCALGTVADGGAAATAAFQCAKLGTADAGIDFATLFGCVEQDTNCLSSSDLNGCLGGAVSPDGGVDGGPGVCFGPYEVCLSQGLGCGSILGCLQQIEGTGALPTPDQISNCAAIGTVTAQEDFGGLFQCIEGACTVGGAFVDGGLACILDVTAADGGACVSLAGACLTDPSANP